MKKRIKIIAGLIVFALAGLTFVSKTVYNSSVPDITAVKARSGFIPYEADCFGEIFYMNETVVKAGGNWTVAEVFAEEGMPIKAGELICTFDKDAFEAERMTLELEIFSLENALSLPPTDNNNIKTETQASLALAKKRLEALLSNPPSEEREGALMDYEIQRMSLELEVLRLKNMLESYDSAKIDIKAKEEAEAYLKLAQARLDLFLTQNPPEKSKKYEETWAYKSELMRLEMEVSDAKHDLSVLMDLQLSAENNSYEIEQAQAKLDIAKEQLIRHLEQFPEPEEEASYKIELMRLEMAVSEAEHNLSELLETDSKYAYQIEQAKARVKMAEAQLAQFLEKRPPDTYEADLKQHDIERMGLELDILRAENALNSLNAEIDGKAVAEAKAQLDIALARLESFLSRDAYDEDDIKREKANYEIDIMSIELEIMRYENQLAALNKNNASEENTKAETLASLNLAKTRLNRFYSKAPPNEGITAPCGGIIYCFNVKEGNSLPEGETLIKIVPENGVPAVKFNLPIAEGDKYKDGAKVTAEFAVAEIGGANKKVLSREEVKGEVTSCVITSGIWEFTSSLEAFAGFPVSGQEVALSITNTGGSYTNVLPKSCIHERYDGEKVIYVINTRDGIFGEESYLVETKVDVLRENEFYAAIDDKTFYSKSIMAYSADKVKNGTVVWVTETTDF